MNVNGLISMVTRMVLRHLVQGGINGVVNKMGQRHEKRNKAAGKETQNPWTAENKKRADQTVKIARKINRF
jgi:hypothetical protein